MKLLLASLILSTPLLSQIPAPPWNAGWIQGKRVQVPLTVSSSCVLTWNILTAQFECGAGGGGAHAVLNNQANTYTGGGAQNFGTSSVVVGSTTVDGTVTGTLGTAAVKNTGTSGATVPLLNGGNIWSGAAVFQGDTRVWGSTGGDFELTADLVATGSNTPVTAPFFFSNNYWTGSASAEDAWIFRSQLATGTNSASTVILQKSFGSSGPAQFFLNYNNGSPYSASGGVNVSSPLFGIGGNYWNGSSSAADSWTIQNVLGAGTNPASTLTFVHSGSSGTAGVNMPILTAPGVNTNTFISNGVQVNTNNISASFYAPLIMQPGVPIIETLATPASSSATCTTGSISWDANFIYICTATNTLKRAALSTF